MTTDVPGRGRLAVCFDFEGGYGMPHHKNLARVCSLLEDFTGSRPQNFRALYLLAPHFYRAEVYAMLRAQGFRCGLPLVVPDLRPGRAVRRGPCPVRRDRSGPRRGAYRRDHRRPGRARQDVRRRAGVLRRDWVGEIADRTLRELTALLEPTSR